MTPSATHASTSPRAATSAAPPAPTRSAPSAPTSPVPHAVPADRYRQLGAELDAVKARVLAELGAEDLAHVDRMRRISTAAEVIGRVLIHVSLDPVTFSAGVVALWLHKQLEATEIGHTVLHGAYDKLPDARWRSATFAWDVPIDEAAWRHGHNHRHHGNTNVAGKDPDIHFGPIRLTAQTPYRPSHRYQHLLAIGVLAPLFTFGMNLHFTGVSDVLTGTDDFLPDRSPASIRAAWRQALRKYVPYYAKNFGWYPLLAGPFAAKVLLGNLLAEIGRDLYSAATIYCGHVGDDVASWPAGTKPGSRGEWYAMQIEATNNFEVSRPVSILCGGLDRQIEHHLFPTLPPPRLRQIAPEVRAICARHGVPYKTASWGTTLGKALGHIKRLATDGGARAVLRAAA
ncbi:MAG: fatty acid desaturase [Kofleriaceae bacterium]